MKQPTKILIVVVTLLPFVCMFIFLALFIRVMLSPPPREMPVIFLGNALTYIWLPVMSVLYLVHVLRNGRLSKNMKILWAVILFLGNMYTMPVYWYLYIWREDPRLQHTRN